MGKHRLRWFELPDSFRIEFADHPEMQQPFNRVSAKVFENILIKHFGFESTETVLGDQWGTFYLDDRDYQFFLLRWA